MKIIRQKSYSFGNSLSDKISERLDRERCQDYEVSNRIPSDAIGINSDLNNLEIYIPEDMEYDQYEIDDFIRNMVPFSRTNVVDDRNIFIMTVSKKLTEDQYYKLVKFIINEYEFCVIVNNN